MSMTQVHTVDQVPGTPSKLGAYNHTMDGATKLGDHWWTPTQEGPQSVKVDIDAPLPVDKHGKTKKLKAKKGFGLAAIAIFLRILGLAAGFAMCALGGWILYKIALAKTASQMVQFAAFGVFLLLCGLLTVLVETRTKRTMRGCLNTYIIVSSYLSRGLFYLVIGALTFAVKNFKYPPPYVQIVWIAAGVVAIGAINLIYYPFYCTYQRKDSIIKSNPPKIGNAEELAYDMAIYDPEKKAAAMAVINQQKQAQDNASPIGSPMMGAPMKYSQGITASQFHSSQGLYSSTASPVFGAAYPSTYPTAVPVAH